MKYYINKVGNKILSFGSETPYVLARSADGAWYVKELNNGETYYAGDDNQNYDCFVKSGAFVEVELIPRTGFDIKLIS